MLYSMAMVSASCRLFTTSSTASTLLQVASAFGFSPFPLLQVSLVMYLHNIQSSCQPIAGQARWGKIGLQSTWPSYNHILCSSLKDWYQDFPPFQEADETLHSPAGGWAQAAAAPVRLKHSCFSCSTCCGQFGAGAAWPCRV